MTNLVSAIGTTTSNGETKVRFTTGDMVGRSKSWSRSGADTDFVELPQAMTRLDALRFLQKHERFQTPDRAHAILEMIILKEVEIKRTERRAIRAARRSGETLVSLSDIRSRKTDTIEV